MSVPLCYFLSLLLCILVQLDKGKDLFFCFLIPLPFFLSFSPADSSYWLYFPRRKGEAKQAYPFYIKRNNNRNNNITSVPNTIDVYNDFLFVLIIIPSIISSFFSFSHRYLLNVFLAPSIPSIEEYQGRSRDETWKSLESNLLDLYTSPKSK